MTIPDNFSAEERSERAMAFFHKGYNCSQAVAMAFSDIMGLDEKTVAALATGFGGGMGRMRKVCGTVSGMALVSGFLVPACDDATVKTQKAANYALVQSLAGEFKEMNGSIICRELLGLSPSVKETHVPAERTSEYYKKRPCEELVGISAGILARKILSL